MKLCYIACTDPVDDLDDEQEVILFDYVCTTFKKFIEIKEEINKDTDHILSEQCPLDREVNELMESHLICWN